MIEETIVQNPKAPQISKMSDFTLFTDLDIDLFKSGKHYKLHEKFGSHFNINKGVEGVYFALWAPHAKAVSIKFSQLNKLYPMYSRIDQSGIWEMFIPGIKKGNYYNYIIQTPNDEILEKSDPFAFKWEGWPEKSSVVWDTSFSWNDNLWMQKRSDINALNKPISVYELHIGSWSKTKDSADGFLNYRQIAETLIPYVKEMGFTHVEFMPLMEHPYYPSWGYLITNYFATTSRYGSPQDLMYLIESLHLNDIGVILDWVPSHFPGDDHGLYQFDGTHLYECEDPKKGFHPDWKSYIFDYGKNEVKSFLISNALFWLECFHADGIRVDAVSSMLYLDYSRKEGEWEPNIHGGIENLEAMDFLRELNQAIDLNFPDVRCIAEESSAFPAITKSVDEGGLGFDMKWMMGWMNDTLEYFSKDPIERKYVHHRITSSINYAFSENFMLALSHDEVVHGKGSILTKMPGDEWQKFANLRVLYVYMFTHPGTKFLFMGNEFGQVKEWDYNKSLDWNLLEHEPHLGIKKIVTNLNQLYKSEPALYVKSFEASGFEWLVSDDIDNSILAYLRKGFDAVDDILVILNLTPVFRKDYRIGIHTNSEWNLILNSDEQHFYGAGLINQFKIFSEFVPSHGRDHSLIVDLPPLSGLIYKRAI